MNPLGSTQIKLKLYIYNTLIKSHILKVSYPSLELIKVQRDFQYEDLKKITHLYYDI